MENKMLEVLEGIRSEIKKHNEIQEEVKREMKLRNDLIAFGIERHREIPTMGLMEDMGRYGYDFLRRNK